MLSRLLCFLALFVSLGLSAQFASPVTWSFDSRHVEGDTWELIATGVAEDGWVVYSLDPGEGPVPTSLTFAEGDHYKLIGKITEKGKLKSGYDKVFDADISKFLSGEPVVFTQRVEVTNYGEPISGYLEFMTCDDEQCLPPKEEPFDFDLTPPSPGRGEVAPEPESPAPATPATPTPDASGAGASSGTSGRTPASPAPAKVDEPTGNGAATSTSAPNSIPSAPAAAPDNPPQPPEGGSARTIATASERGVSYTAAMAPPTSAKPVSWSFTATELGENRYELALTGTLAEGWTSYSMTADPDPGAIPTEFALTTTDGIEILTEVTETGDHIVTKYDKAWEAEMTKIDGGTVTYRQTIAVQDAARIAGYVYFQTCDDEQCLPPEEIPFALDLSDDTPVASVDGVAAGAAPPATGVPTIAVGESPSGLPVSFDATPIGTCSVGAETTGDKSLLSIFGLGLLGGLFALIMPCIFPMIPLTVSFFTKSGGNRAKGIRDASLYGFFIFLIYVLLSAPFHLVDGLEPGLLNDIASSVPLNIIFFLAFMYFAGSFFGFYEIKLPDSWGNRASQAEGTGGVTGIFFMALTLALVSFSCTGPILGSLLVEAVAGGAWPLTAGMAGFGVALGLPFALFAAFPGVLASMPKSGGWLNSVKVVLGFAEIALALKFLSNADLVGEWDILKLEPFLLIWILCAVGIAAYLFGLISFPLDSKNRKVGVVGGAIAVAALVFAGYLGMGFLTDPDTGTYRTRNVISGIAPATCYNFLQPCDAELNITPFKSLEEGLAYAREVNKPVMLDFTGYSCQNCRKMEDNVWSEPEIKRYLQEDFVIVSLYTDDRSELPASEVREVTRLDGTGRKKTIDQVGEKWHYFQQTVYARSSQPYYVLVSPDGQTLNPPVAYTPDVAEYENFLACGLSTYRELQGK